MGEVKRAHRTSIQEQRFYLEIPAGRVDPYDIALPDMLREMVLPRDERLPGYEPRLGQPLSLESRLPEIKPVAPGIGNDDRTIH